MNEAILSPTVQEYIQTHLDTDVQKLALSKSPFSEVSTAELATQITAKKKAKHKLPNWFLAENIYYPPALSIEQSSSEITANYKANLAKGDCVLDLTAGFGVDSFYFAQKSKKVISCEINEELSQISAHNAHVLGAKNLTCLASDGLAYLKQSDDFFDTIYIDPARRNTSGKVFKLADCTPNMVEHLDFLLSKAANILVKTSPLLDLTAGLKELKNVAEIHLVSVKNECKELLWLLKRTPSAAIHITCVTCNQSQKLVTFNLDDVHQKALIAENVNQPYLYEPDAALMKSGAFDWIGNQYGLEKLAPQSHLYLSKEIKPSFLGRIFSIKQVLTLHEFKKMKNLQGNVLVRNFPEKAENLAKKYNITPAKETFIVFTKTTSDYVVFIAEIVQYY